MYWGRVFLVGTAMLGKTRHSLMLYLFSVHSCSNTMMPGWIKTIVCCSVSLIVTCLIDIAMNSINLYTVE